MPRSIPCYRRGETSTRIASEFVAPQYAWDAWREGLLVSDGHYQRQDGSWSGGGPFYVEKVQQYQGDARFSDWWYLGGHWRGVSKGVVLGPNARLSSLPSNPTWSAKYDALLPSYATGRARTRPGRPMAGLGQFLIELRDLPTVPGKALYRAGLWRRMSLRSLGYFMRNTAASFRALGSEYLNVVFGWEPFVRDLREVYNLSMRIDREMAQLRRNNGRGVRRKVTLEDTKNSTQSTPMVTNQAFVGVRGGPPGSYAPNGKSVYKLSTFSETHTWFSACYRYWIPDVNSVGWNVRSRLALFGVLPTPELIWEVTPWSWLIDWFSNAGDVIANVSPTAVDFVTTYAYIMKHEKAETAYTVETSWSSRHDAFYSIDGGCHTFSSGTKTETKARAGDGNPFGLGVKLPTLTGRQLGILAALGLSRSSVR